jgi:hypothetical protein
VEIVKSPEHVSRSLGQLPRIEKITAIHDEKSFHGVAALAATP